MQYSIKLKGCGLPLWALPPYEYTYGESASLGLSLQLKDVSSPYLGKKPCTAKKTGKLSFDVEAFLLC